MRTRETFKTDLSNNLEAERTLLIALENMLGQAEKLTHYKKIDGRYTGKLKEATNGSHIWIREGYKSFDGMLTELQIEISLPFRDPYHNSNVIDGEDYTPTYYVQETRYICKPQESGNYKELLPAEVPDAIRRTIDAVKEKITTLENELEGFDLYVDNFNDWLDHVAELDKLRDRYSHTLRQILDFPTLPYSGRTRY